MDLEDFALDPEEVTADGPDLQPEPDAHVVAFDPGLSRMGWANVLAQEGNWRVLQTGMFDITPRHDLDGSFADTFDRAVQIHRQAAVLFAAFPDSIPLVTEMPPVGYVAGRSNASLVADLTLRLVAEIDGRPFHLMNAQQVKHRLTGDRGAAKRAVREAVIARTEPLNRKVVGPLNDDTYDAIAIGMVATSTEMWGTIRDAR